MSTQSGYFKCIAWIVPALSIVGCAMPSSPTYNQGTASRSPSSTASGSDSVNIGSNSYTNSNSNSYSNSGTNYGSTTSSVTSSSTNTGSTNQTTPPTCSISTPQLKNYYGYYYIDATMTVTSSVPIAYVTYSLSSSYLGIAQVVGMATTAPYEVYYAMSSYGTATLTATITDVNGQTYPSACASAYTINWKSN